LICLHLLSVRNKLNYLDLQNFPQFSTDPHRIEGKDVHTSSPQRHDMIFIHPCFPEHRPTMKILSSIYSGVSHMSCVIFSHSLPTKIYIFLFVIALMKYESHIFICVKMYNVVNIDKNFTTVQIGKSITPRFTLLFMFFFLYTMSFTILLY
jgi:hypothetical protein